MLITLIGPERFLVAQALQKHLAKFAPAEDSFGDVNLTRFDGARITPDELARAVQSIGFFDEKRVIVVESLLSRFTGGKSAEGDGGSTENAEPAPRGRGKADAGLTEGFAQVFGLVPDSTVLILVERGSINKNSALLKAAARHGKVEEFRPPTGGMLERWIAERGKEAGVKITPGALSALAATLPDLQTLANELDKLSLYVGEGGIIDEKALRQMSFASRQDDVFEMTSAVARRDTRGALQQLRKLTDGGTQPEGILPVLAWQVRTLIQVRDMLDRRVPEHRMAEKSGLSDYMVQKSVSQARHFSMKKLLQIHTGLLELDHAIKTGRAQAELSLDTLVVEMCQ